MGISEESRSWAFASISPWGGKTLAWSKFTTPNSTQELCFLWWHGWEELKSLPWLFISHYGWDHQVWSGTQYNTAKKYVAVIQAHNHSEILSSSICITARACSSLLPNSSELRPQMTFSIISSDYYADYIICCVEHNPAKGYKKLMWTEVKLGNFYTLYPLEEWHSHL